MKQAVLCLSRSVTCPGHWCAVIYISKGIIRAKKDKGKEEKSHLCYSKHLGLLGLWSRKAFKCVNTSLGGSAWHPCVGQVGRGFARHHGEKPGRTLLLIPAFAASS